VKNPQHMLHEGNNLSIFSWNLMFTHLSGSSFSNVINFQFHKIKFKCFFDSNAIKIEFPEMWKSNKIEHCGRNIVRKRSIFNFQIVCSTIKIKESEEELFNFFIKCDF
jgi:hypothetical protein